MDIIANYGICNTASVNIYNIIYGIEDYILAGINKEEPKEYLIEYDEEGEPYFNIGFDVYLNECMRI